MRLFFRRVYTGLDAVRLQWSNGHLFAWEQLSIDVRLFFRRVYTGLDAVRLQWSRAIGHLFAWENELKGYRLEGRDWNISDTWLKTYHQFEKMRLHWLCPFGLTIANTFKNQIGKPDFFLQI